jgi:mono/diheme cytochrome c family protein
MTTRAQWLAAGSGVGVLILLAVASLIWLDARTEPTAPDPNNVSLAVRGKTVYTQYCASCHGTQLQGQPNWRGRQSNGRLPAPPHDASGHTWHHADKELFEIIKHGIPEIVPGYQTDMPKYEGVLNDADIWAVLSYIESTWSPDIRARQQRVSERKR